jgi:hypothetical protein
MGFWDMIGDKWYILLGIGLLMFSFFIISEVSRRKEKKKALEKKEASSETGKN